MELHTNTIIIILLFIILWIASLFLIKDREIRSRLSWTNILLSFFGISWLVFGNDYLFRFLILVYDPVYFQATNFPVWQLPADVISQTFFSLALFWIFFCLGFALLVFWVSRKPPRLLQDMEQLASLTRLKLLDAVAVCTTLLIIITTRGLVPSALVTPLGRLSSLCAVPLTVSWILHYRGQPIGMRRFIYLLPLVLNYLLMPFRGTLLTMILCMLLPLLQFRKNISISKVLVGALIFLLASTYVNGIYRAYTWGSQGRDREPDSLAEKWKYWKEDPGKSPWVRAATRFHGFDSMALTVYSVPVIFPYSNRNILSEFFLIGFVPRMLLDTKPNPPRGRQFSTTIWSLDLQRVGKRTSAPIAPSMPGDLYHIHGIPILILGGFLYGLLIGLLENWLRASLPTVKCIMLALFGLEVGGLLTSDFVFATATLVQHLIAIFFGFFILKQFMIPHIKSKPVKLRLN